MNGTLLPLAPRLSLSHCLRGCESKHSLFAECFAFRRQGATHYTTCWFSLLAARARSLCWERRSEQIWILNCFVKALHIRCGQKEWPTSYPHGHTGTGWPRAAHYAFAEGTEVVVLSVAWVTADEGNGKTNTKCLTVKNGRCALNLVLVEINCARTRFLVCLLF